MPQITPEISDRRGFASTRPSTDANAGAGTDRLLKLHKMSTTAGVGSGDYVAINGTSIAAALLGVGSLLALLSPEMLFIPLIGAVCGVLALRQIGQSNGTQTGRALAIAGLVLSVVVGGGIASGQVVKNVRERADQRVIDGLIAQLGQDVKQGNLAEAYGRMGERFRQAVPQQRFVDIMNSGRQNDRFGMLVDLKSNELVSFQTEAGGVRVAVATGLMKFDKVEEPLRQRMAFRQVDGRWEIDALPDLFLAAPQGGPGAAPGPASAPPAGVQGPPVP